MNVFKELKKNLSVSVPLICAQLIYASSGFIGTAFVARLGQDALAASILVSTVWLSVSVLFFGILNAVCVLVSHQYGAGNKVKISEIMGQSFKLGLVLSVLIILLMLTLPWFLKLSTQPPMVLKLATSYVYALTWTIPSLILLIIYEEFLAGINLAKIVLRISIAIVPIEIPIIYALIFGKFGLPKCGVAGIGYGFAITYTLTAIYLTWHFSTSKYYKDFALYKNLFKVQWRHLRDLVAIGTPIGLMHTIELTTFMILTFWMARFGTTMLAAHQIVFQFLSFVTTFVFAMAQAVTIRVGHEVGHMKVKNIGIANAVGFAITTLVMSMMAIAFYYAPNFFLSIDINVHDPKNHALMMHAAQLLGICGVFMVIDSIRIIGFGALRGLKDTSFPMYATIISSWILGLSFSYYLAFHTHMQGYGIWLGLTLGNVVGALLIVYRIHSQLKRLDLKTVLDQNPSKR